MRKPLWAGFLFLIAVQSIWADFQIQTSSVKEADTVVFYVSTDGNDASTGTKEAPFATLKRARDAVRDFKTNDHRNITVVICGGRYVFHETLVFGLEDSAADGQMITYKAADGEHPVLSGGVELSGWVRTDLPGNIWVADFPGDAKNALTLYCGTSRLQRARGKGFSSTKIYARNEMSGPVTDTIEFPSGVLKNYADLKNAEVVVRTSAAWAMNILPLLSVDEQNRIAKTAPCNYALGQIISSPATPDDMWVENVLDELDSPGEWVVHPDEKKVYYWPLDNEKPADVIFPLVAEIVRVEGIIDYNGATDTPVQGLCFEGLSFMHADRMLTPENIKGQGLQHGWDYFDAPNAMFRFRGAKDCTVKDCHFTAGGSDAIRLDLSAQNITIEDSLFDHLGGAAAVFAGYGLGTKDENKNNAFLNNHVHHVCQLKRDRPAVFVWQSGSNRIANNLIHNVPYVAISVSCRAAIAPGLGEGYLSRRENEIVGDYSRIADYEGWKSRERFWHGRNNLIASNEIFSAVELIADGNPIYVSGTAGGNQVRDNYIHDCWSYNVNAAIRCDDDQHETLIEGNLTADVAGSASAIVIKGKNDVINNICVDIYRNDEDYHVGMLAVRSYKPDGCRIERNVFYCPDPARIVSVVAGRTRPQIGNEQIELKSSQVRNNLFWAPLDPSWAKDYLNEAVQEGSEQGSLVADPLFTPDFNFTPGSPALTLGIVPVTPDGKGVNRSMWKTYLAELSADVADESLRSAEKIGISVKNSVQSGASGVNSKADR
ncbi:MAG: right-handed parallel beta-helix repeat-containing protein [Kiritimatiellales bacterium]